MSSMKTVKVLRVKTGAAARIVVRNGTGKKLFDMDVLGVSITIAVPSDAVIRIDPSQAVKD